jgi:hypothetical protein
MNIFTQVAYDHAYEASCGVFGASMAAFTVGASMAAFTSNTPLEAS